MHSIPNAIVGVAVLAVAVVLILGLVNMLRQGPARPIGRRPSCAGASACSSWRSWRSSSCSISGRIDGSAQPNLHPHRRRRHDGPRRRRSVARNSTRASRPMAKSTSSIASSASRASRRARAIPTSLASTRRLARTQNDLFDLGADLCVPPRGDGETAGRRYASRPRRSSISNAKSTR